MGFSQSTDTFGILWDPKWFPNQKCYEMLTNYCWMCWMILRSTNLGESPEGGPR